MSCWVLSWPDMWSAVGTKSAIAREGLQAEKRGDGVVRGVGPEMRSSGPVMRRDSWKTDDTCSKVVVLCHWNFQSGNKLFSVIILLYRVRLIMMIGSSSVIISLQDCLFWCVHIVFAVLSVPSTGRGLSSDWTRTQLSVDPVASLDSGASEITSFLDS